MTRPSSAGHASPVLGTRTCDLVAEIGHAPHDRPDERGTRSPANRGYVDVIARIFKDARSAQDVLDHALRPLLLGDALLVLRRDELGDQSERDELDSDDHEQHPEA